MSTGNVNGQMLDTIPASADLSANQNLLHTINSSGQLVLASVLGQRVHCILEDKPTAQGRAALVCYGGLCSVTAGGTFAPGDPLTPDAAGKAIKAVNATDYVFGTAKEAGAAGANASVYFSAVGATLS